MIMLFKTLQEPNTVVQDAEEEKLLDPRDEAFKKELEEIEEK